jgi:integrase
LEKGAKAAGLNGKLFHDFRRSAARDLIAAGNDYGTAMSIAGHNPRRVRPLPDRRHPGDAAGLERLEA